MPDPITIASHWSSSKHCLYDWPTCVILLLPSGWGRPPGLPFSDESCASKRRRPGGLPYLDSCAFIQNQTAEQAQIVKSPASLVHVAIHCFQLEKGQLDGLRPPFFV